ncbi:MAG: thiamine pyrophosphate-dependent enzyme [Chloroflexota bacterium]|nr:thiamine pyrophosphate-dependent enzyme [Chloroflexota bacterium]
MSKMSGGDALISSLEREGVEVIFGLPGVQMYGVVDALRRNKNIKMIVPRHEQATSYMADGYARASRGIGVAMVVPGPGLYNAAAGLSTAYSSNSRVLMIAGQIPRDTIGKDMGGLHEVNDQLETIKPVTKFQKRLLRPNEIPQGVSEAFSQLKNGRPRPVEIEMPPETMVESEDVQLLEASVFERDQPDENSISEAVKLILAAKKPVIYAGTGVIRSEAEEELKDLTELTNIPVVTSAAAKGVISDEHPNSLGSALTGEGQIKNYLESCDLIIILGSRFAIRYPAAEDTKKNQVEIDKSEIGKFHDDVLPVIGDAKVSINKISQGIKAMGGTNLNSPTEDIKKIRKILDSGIEGLHPQHEILNSLREGMPRETISVWDMTQLGYYSRAAFKTYNTSSYFDSGYSGNLGWAFPTAIGAKVAKPNSPVVSVSGDGGFMYNVQELSTAVKYGINLVAVIFNDGYYGNVRRDLELDWGGDYETSFVNPDFAKMAETYGAKGITVDDPTKVNEAIEEGLAANKPTLIDVNMIDTNEVPRPFAGRAPWTLPHDELLD